MFFISLKISLSKLEKNLNLRYSVGRQMIKVYQNSGDGKANTKTHSAQGTLSRHGE